MGRVFSCFITAICITFIFLFVVNAQESIVTYPDITIEQDPVSSDEETEALKSLNYEIREYQEDVYKQAWISNFDVSKSEMLAVAFDNNTIVISDRLFQTKCVIAFDSHGTGYYVNWNGDILELFFNKINYIYSFSSTGKLIGITKKIMTGQNLGEITYRRKDIVNSNTYQLRTSNPTMWLTLGGYDMLVVTDALGYEKVLFCSDNNFPVAYFLNSMVWVAGQIFFAVLIITGIVRIKKRGKEQRGQGDGLREP